MIRLKFERLKRDMSQKELGERTGVPYTDICRYETGRMKPYPKHLQRLSQYLGIPAETLLEEVE